jgi:hypothetical protein
MSHPPNHTFRSHRRGPITHVDNGRGGVPWLQQAIPDPGYVYHYLPQFLASRYDRCCYRCLPALQKRDQGFGRTSWDEESPPPGSRCPRYARPYGEPPEAGAT